MTHRQRFLFAFGFLGLLVTLALAAMRPPNLAASENDWTQFFRAGQEDMRVGRYASAIQNFGKVLSLHPGMVEAEVNLGLAYNAAGEYKLAVAPLSKAVRARPDLLPANLFLGISYLKLGQPAQAIPALEQALQSDSANRQARRALATAELAEGEYQKASAGFRALAGAQSDKAAALFDLGRDYLHMAAQLTTQLSGNYTAQAWPLRLAGDALADQGRWSGAADDYQKALQRAPGQANSADLADLHAALGHALLESGNITKANSEFAAALAQDPSDPDALLGTTEARLDQGDASGALTAVNNVARRAPEMLPWALAGFTPRLSPSAAQRMVAKLDASDASMGKEFLLAAVYHAAGDAAKAQQQREALQDLVKQAQDTGAPAGDAASACRNHQEKECVQYLASQRQLSLGDLFVLGKAFFGLHQDEHAALAFSTVLAAQPSDPRTMYWLDRSYLRLSDACFNQLSASYPGTWMALELKGDALRARQSNLEAIAAYRAAERLNPGNAEIHEALAGLLLKKNQTGPGKDELEAALRLDPSSARSLYLLGNLYVYAQQPARGIPYLEAALRYDPTLVEARVSLGRAYLRTGKPALAAAQFEQSLAMDHYGDLHYMLYQAYREEGKTQLAAQALAQSQAMRRKSELEDQAKLRGSGAN